MDQSRHRPPIVCPIAISPSIRTYTATLEDFAQGHFGWKAVVGIRPLSLLGAELECLDLAYGAGIQFKLAAFAVRAEYERIGASDGQPDFLSLGATFSFGRR